MSSEPFFDTDTYSLHRGTQPLLVSCPHDGAELPPTLAARMVENARRSPDTDWHVARLYAFARELGASMIVPKYSRYVVDLNRPVDGAALYPGRAETGLVPTITFANEPIYLEGAEPVAEEIAGRVRTYWQPYHDALAAELERLRAVHGRVVLWDAHSIRSEVPMFFAGRLPDFNIGTADGASAGMALQQKLVDVLSAQDAFTHVVNGRFKGGYITRHYGRPSAGIEAVQLELAQVNYMNEDSFEFLPGRAAAVQALVRRLLEAAIAPA